VRPNTWENYRWLKAFFPACWRLIADSLTIAKKLVAPDAVIVQWQIDLAVSYCKLGTHVVLTSEERRVYLKQGFAILNRLQNEGHLPPNQNWSNRFEEVLTGQDAATED